jgi:hypothetical protein
MTMLTHTRGPFERACYSSARRDTVGAGCGESAPGADQAILFGRPYDSAGRNRRRLIAPIGS